MRPDRKIFAHAKKLLALSLQDGAVSAERVEAVLTALRTHPPRNAKAILRAYAKLIKRAIAGQTAAVESAVPLDESALKVISQHFSQQYGRPIVAQSSENPSLIAGLRVRIGDDLYDASITGRLERLAAGVR
jgi:F-type H+-transporting ATPase subunit delta